MAAFDEPFQFSILTVRDMFDISFMELLVISVVALIVIGPERLPTVAKTLGHLYGRCRNFVYSVRTDIHNEMRMEELKKMQSTLEETVQSVENTVRQNVNQVQTTVTDELNQQNQSTIQSTHSTSTQTIPPDPVTHDSTPHQHRNQDKN